MKKPEVTKDAIREFWSNRPCGIAHSDASPESLRFFSETEEKRFLMHRDWETPFLHGAIGFEDFTGKSVLEVGAGIGVDALEWSRADNHVVALDLNMPSCQITRDRFSAAGNDGTFVNGDAENLPFPDESFDLVYSFGVLHHTPQTEKSIRELHRCLKRQGIAVVMLYYKYSAMVWGDIVCGYGIRHGRLRRERSLSNLISHYTEWQSQTEDSINPLTKVYSKRQVRRMFGDFSRIELELHYLRPAHFGPFRKLVSVFPYGVKSRLHRVLGWNLIIRATK